MTECWDDDQAPMDEDHDMSEEALEDDEEGTGDYQEDAESYIHEWGH